MKDKIVGMCLAVLLGLAIGWAVAEVHPIKATISSLPPARGTVTYHLVGGTE